MIIINADKCAQAINIFFIPFICNLKVVGRCRVFVAKPLENLREVSLQRSGDAIGEPGAIAAHEEQLICHMMGSDEPIRGDESHRKAMQGIMRSFPDVRVSNDPYPIQFGQGDWTTVVSRITATFTGEMDGPDGKPIPPTGKAFDLDMTTDDKIIYKPSSP